MALKMITSLTNEAVKQVVRLHEAAERKEKKLFIVEGMRAVSTVLQGGLKLHTLYCTSTMSEQAQALVAGKKIVVVSTAAMKKMSAATTPSGILALFSIPKSLPSDALTPGLVLAQISDPGNMGTLIRTAAACGVRSVVVIEGADPWSPKVVQASAGTIALVNIFQFDWEELIEARKSYKLYALVVSGGKPLSSADPKKALIIVGNEARGLPTEWLKECDEHLTLPMPGKTESLNAAIAGSIALYAVFVKSC